MSTTDKSVTDESTESIAAAHPLIPSKPRLRFLEGTPAGAAGGEEEPEGEEGEEPEAPEGEPEAENKPDPDAGAKKALVTERTARKAAEKALAALKAELALKDKPAEEQALEAARAEARTEATQKANERIVRAEVKAAATGKVKNPVLALKLIDTSEIEVDDNGDVDSDAVSAAIDALLSEYPELAADATKFQGSADQGAKGKQTKTAQMTAAEFDRIKGDYKAVKKAKDEGLLNELLGIKS